MSLSKSCYPDVQWRAFPTEKYLLDRTLSSKVSMEEEKEATKSRNRNEVYVPLRVAFDHPWCRQISDLQGTCPKAEICSDLGSNQYVTLVYVLFTDASLFGDFDQSR